jgi:hypothetical protein
MEQKAPIPGCPVGQKLEGGTRATTGFARWQVPASVVDTKSTEAKSRGGDTCDIMPATAVGAGAVQHQTGGRVCLFEEVTAGALPDFLQQFGAVLGRNGFLP